MKPLLSLIFVAGTVLAQDVVYNTPILIQWGVEYDDEAVRQQTWNLAQSWYSYWSNAENFEAIAPLAQFSEFESKTAMQHIIGFPNAAALESHLAISLGNTGLMEQSAQVRAGWTKEAGTIQG